LATFGKCTFYYFAGLGPRHTRYFCTQYCDIAKKRYFRPFGRPFFNPIVRVIFGPYGGQFLGAFGSRLYVEFIKRGTCVKNRFKNFIENSFQMGDPPH